MVDLTATRQRHSLIDVASRYIELKQRGSEYTALCPFHDDHNPSFSIFLAKTDGLYRYKCWSCQAHGDVIDFVSEICGVTIPEAANILNGDDMPAATYKPKPLPPSEAKCWEPILPVPDDAPEYNPAKTYNPKRAREVSYKPSRCDAYLDADGRLLCYVVRLDFGDGTKVCPTITYCEGKGGERRWCAQRMEPPYPLQGLDELAARPNDFVLVVSGEKCKAVAAKMFPTMVAVTYLGGDQAREKADLTPLSGRNVYYMPDADHSSHDSMVALHSAIQDMSPPRESQREA